MSLLAHLVLPPGVTATPTKKKKARLTDGMRKLYKADAPKLVKRIFEQHGLDKSQVDRAVLRGNTIRNMLSREYNPSYLMDKLTSLQWAALATAEILDVDLNYQVVNRAWLVKMLESFFIQQGKLTAKQRSIIGKNLKIHGRADWDYVFKGEVA